MDKKIDKPMLVDFLVRETGLGLACGLGRRRGSDSPPGWHSFPCRFMSSTSNEKGKIKP
jgi:hypothetical protein